jgi:hypothetical protein
MCPPTFGSTGCMQRCRQRSAGPTLISGSSAPATWGGGFPIRTAIEDTGAKTLTYLYDFGDGWEHTIRILRFDDAEAGRKYPALIEAAGRCPPEDVGGPWGYTEFLDAIADPDHEQHDDMTEWYGADFDPEDVPLDHLEAAVADLAARWTRTPRRRKSK